MKILIILLTLCCAALGQNQYYVSTGGSDSNNGTSSGTPWLTLSKANSSLVVGGSGAVVNVAAGTYNSGQIVTSKSGTGSSARIVFLCTVKWTCNIRLTSGSPANIWGVNGSWVDVNGFDVSESGGLTTTYGLIAQGSHVRFIGNRIHDTAGSSATGTCTGNGGAGISLPNNVAGTTDNQALGNLIHDIGTPGRCNKIHGIYAQIANAVVENNVVYRVAAWGLNCSHNCTGTVSNNTVFSNGGYGTSDNGTFAMGGCVLLGSDSTSSGITVNNNICFDNGASGAGAAILNIVGTLNNVQAANNLIQNTSSGNGAGGGQGCTTVATCINLAGGSTHTISGNLLNLDPQFVSYRADGSGDYHLATGSPAIGAGTSACNALNPCTPSTDFDGILRSTVAAIDIGSYKASGGTVAKPSPPTGLTAIVH